MHEIRREEIYLVCAKTLRSAKKMTARETFLRKKGVH